MSRKSQKEETVIFTLFCYIVGIVLVAYGYWWGLIFIGLGFYLTLLLSSAVRGATKAVLSELVRFVRKRASSKPAPTMSSPANNRKLTAQTGIQAQTPFDLVVNKLREWHPARRFNDERQSEVATQQYLHTYFPDQVRYHKYREDFESDLEIGDIGIEIKVLYKTSELQRLGGQLMAYCEHFNHVIALIFNYNHIDLASYLHQWKKRFGNQVEVIEKY